MEQLAGYRSSEYDDSSEGLYESEEDNFIVSGCTRHDCASGTGKVEPQNNSMTCDHARSIPVKQNYPTSDTGNTQNSNADGYPEEGEIVTQPPKSFPVDKRKRDGETRPSAKRRTLKAQGQALVAFSAYMRTCLTTLADGVIPFDKVTMNYGSGYKRHGSIFVCPRTGTYMITWRIVLNESREVTLNLVVNGTVRKRTTFDSIDSGDNSKCESEEIIRLSLGDHVFLTLYNGSCKLFRPKACKFAGIRLTM